MKFYHVTINHFQKVYCKLPGTGWCLGYFCHFCSNQSGLSALLRHAAVALSLQPSQSVVSTYLYRYNSQAGQVFTVFHYFQLLWVPFYACRQYACSQNWRFQVQNILFPSLLRSRELQSCVWADEMGKWLHVQNYYYRYSKKKSSLCICQYHHLQGKLLASHHITVQAF